MRSSKSRSRSKQSRNNRPSGNIVNRVFDSSGPEGKVRGTPQQIIDKYNQLARDAQLSGDRVATENFQQHAEHYLRMLGEAMREQEQFRQQQDQQRQQQDQQNRDRQAERDRERAQRQERESNGGNNPSDPGATPQPDILDALGEDSGLVETPESRGEKPADKPKPKPRSRARPKKPAGDGQEAKAAE